MILLDAVVGLVMHQDRHIEAPAHGLASVVKLAAKPPARFRAFARCVESRESHGNPRAVNDSGHAGLYQFSRDWTHALPYVIARGLKAHGMPAHRARTVRLSLTGTRIERYPAVLQRVAFAQVLREGGVAAAMRHWHLSGSPCNALAVTR